VTITEERPAPSEEPRAEDHDGGISTGEKIAWFGGGFLVFVHLVVIVGFVVLSLGTDPSNRGGKSTAPAPAAPSAAESVFVATEFAFEPTAASETTGNLTITLDNQGEIFHNLVFDEVSGFVLEAETGIVSSGDVQLDDGVYTIFCSVPGHRDLGMEATLTIG
jgi:plastocyanin